MRHVSPVTCCVSRVTYLISITSTATATNPPPEYFEKRKKKTFKSSVICFVFLQPNISDRPFDQTSLVYREVPFPAMDRQTDRHTHKHKHGQRNL